MSSFHVLIIGAGLGGLALASALTRNGIRCTVFERDAKPRDRLQGYRIVVRNEPNVNVYALDVLRQLLPDDLQEKLFSIAGDAGGSATGTDENLNVKHVFQLPGESFSLGRMALREALLDSLSENIMKFDKKFMSYEERNDKIIAKFENGEEVEGDLLVAADGGNSRVRRQFFADHDPRIITGVSGIVGKIAVTPDSEAERIIQRTPLRDGMILVSKSPGRVFYAARHILSKEQERVDEDFLWSNYRSYVYWVLNTSTDEYRSTTTEQQCPQKLSGDELLAYASTRVSDFHADIQTVIRQSDPNSTVWLDFNSGETIEWKTNTRITFVGDSIHGMTPYLGAGALLAIVDGWELSKAVISIVNDNKVEAIEQYETEMKKRSFPIMQMALQRMLKLTDTSK